MRDDQPVRTRPQLATDHDADPITVHTYLGVTGSNCPYCHEEKTMTNEGGSGGSGAGR